MNEYKCSQDAIKQKYRHRRNVTSYHFFDYLNFKLKVTAPKKYNRDSASTQPQNDWNKQLQIYKYTNIDKFPEI